MTEIAIKIVNQVIQLPDPRPRLVAGSVGVYAVKLTYDAQWDNAPVRVVVFDGGLCNARISVQDTTGTVTIPPECIAHGEHGNWLQIGVLGFDGTGALRITTRAMRDGLRIDPAGVSDADVPQDPPMATPGLWEQLVTDIGNLSDLQTVDKSSLVAAINELVDLPEGGGSAVLYTAQELTAAQQKQARENIDVAGYNVINYLWPTEHSGREDTDITTLLDSDVYMGIVKNSTAFPSPGLVMLQGPMPGNVYTAVLLAKDGLTYTATFQYVRSTKHFAVLTPVAAASSKVISVKLTTSESDENVYTADRNIIEIEEALQAGHMALAYTPDAAGLQNSVGLITSCVRTERSSPHFVTVLRCFDTFLASMQLQVGEDGITWTGTNYVEYAPSGWVAELESVMPLPVGKTDAMTQAVGMDETGKLWTQPGASGGGGETWELIAEIDFDVDAANDVSVWEYKNLPNYKEIAYKKVGLVGSTETASGLSISINDSVFNYSSIQYAKKGGQSNGWGKILLLPFGWIHVNSGSAALPTNYSFGGLQTIYNAIPFDGDSITSVRLSAHAQYKIAGGKLSLYGRK